MHDLVDAHRGRRPDLRRGLHLRVDVSPFKLTNNPVYPAVAEDARRSIARLRSLRADVMLGAHGFWFDLTGKAARLARSRAPNPFLDPAELGRHLDEMTRDLDQAVAAQERPRSP
jgi:metallo-beta-lactamase class B